MYFFSFSVFLYSDIEASRQTLTGLRPKYKSRMKEMNMNAFFLSFHLHFGLFRNMGRVIIVANSTPYGTANDLLNLYRRGVEQHIHIHACMHTYIPDKTIPMNLLLLEE